MFVEDITVIQLPSGYEDDRQLHECDFGEANIRGETELSETSTATLQVYSTYVRTAKLHSTETVTKLNHECYCVLPEGILPNDQGYVAIL